jgi:V/A-type H+-transporting ATPase subunit F
MYKIAVIGGRDTVIGFKALGLETYPVENTADAKRVMNTLSKPENGYAIIYLEENLAEALKAEINRVKDKPAPAVILIPGRDGSLGLGLTALREAVDKAIGSNVLGD